MSNVKPFVRAQGEFTPVSKETEVRIPWLTYVLKSVVLMFVDLGLWLTGWLIWLRANLKAMSFWRWLNREWLEWFSLGWVWVVISLVWCWIGPSAMAYLYRLFVEQIVKQLPQYTPYPSEMGRWKPFARQQSVEYEADAQPVETQEQGAYTVTGEMKRGSKSTLYLEFKLEDYAAALKWHRFCKAVQNGRKFSYNEAVRRHKLSSRDWRRIYRAFTAQQWAIPAKRRGTPTLRAVGKHWIKMYAETPPTPPPG